MLTRILITIFAALLITATIQAQCKALTHQHLPCKLPADSTGYCMVHRPHPTCGAMTTKGTPCKQRVSKPGEHCRFHQYSGVHVDRVFPSHDGLLSVWFTQNGRKYGLDDITPMQLDSLKKVTL